MSRYHSSYPHYNYHEVALSIEQVLTSREGSLDERTTQLEKLYEMLTGQDRDTVVMDLLTVTPRMEPELLQYFQVMAKESNLENRERNCIDDLTGAYNRKLFDSRLKEEIYAKIRRNGNPFCLAYLDLDHLKKLNDQFHHSVGDAVLKEFVTDVSDVLRITDGLYRIGGDEFAVIIDRAHKEEGLFVSEKMRYHLQHDFRYETTKHTREEIISKIGHEIETSVGLAVFDEDVLEKIDVEIAAEQLKEKADMAMYFSKHTNKVGYWQNGNPCLYQPTESDVSKAA